jgi:hypothetical protein
VEPRFSIGLHVKDLALLQSIQSFFGGIGAIQILSTRQKVTFSVQSIKDLKKLISHFDKYPLMTQKRGDFLLFKKAVELINKGEHLTAEGLGKIVAIKASLNLGLSAVLTEAFPNITPVARPEIVDQEISDPNWLAGFVEAFGGGMFLCGDS